MRKSLFARGSDRSRSNSVSDQADYRNEYLTNIKINYTIQSEIQFPLNFISGSISSDQIPIPESAISHLLNKNWLSVRFAEIIDCQASFCPIASIFFANPVLFTKSDIIQQTESRNDQFPCMPEFISDSISDQATRIGRFMPDRGISRSDGDHSIGNSRPVPNHLPPAPETESSHEQSVRSATPKPSDAHRHGRGSHGPGRVGPDNSAGIWPATTHDTDSEPGDPAAYSGPTQTG